MENEVKKIENEVKKMEEDLLGAAMLNEEVAKEMVEMLLPQNFSTPKNKMIYDAICSICENRGTADMLTVSEKLKENGNLESVGGRARIAEIVTETPSTIISMDIIKKLNGYKRDEDAKKILKAVWDINETILNIILELERKTKYE